MNNRRPVYASRKPSTDTLGLATFEGVTLATLTRDEALRLAEEIHDLFQAYPVYDVASQPLSAPSPSASAQKETT